MGVQNATSSRAREQQDVLNKYFEAYHIDYDKNLSGFKNGLFLNIFCETYARCPITIENG